MLFIVIIIIYFVEMHSCVKGSCSTICFVFLLSFCYFKHCQYLDGSFFTALRSEHSLTK